LHVPRAEHDTEGYVHTKQATAKADTVAVPACAPPITQDELHSDGSFLFATELSSGSLILPESPAVEPNTQTERYSWYLARSQLHEVARVLQTQKSSQHPKVCKWMCYAVVPKRRLNTYMLQVQLSPKTVSSPTADSCSPDGTVRPFMHGSSASLSSLLVPESPPTTGATLVDRYSWFFTQSNPETLAGALIARQDQPAARQAIKVRTQADAEHC
jgi:hypothetical protein